MQTFDAIIIGSGQGGTPLAKKLAKAGFKTLIIEKRFVGGTCTNDGCTPTKTMIASAKRAYQVRNSHELGIISDGGKADFQSIMDRKNKIVLSSRKGAEDGLVKTPNLTLIHGEASFLDKNTITVHLENGSDETVQSGRIFINAGAITAVPPIPGLDAVPYYTSTTLLDAHKLPDHLIVLGGSYIALEFAQMFRRFGSTVTIIEKAAFLDKEDDDIANNIKGFLEEEDIKIYTHASVARVASMNGQITVTMQVDDKEQTITGSDLLVATGRNPQTAALHLDKAGVRTDEKGYIIVDEYLETAVPGIFALGDIKGGPAFTHIAYNDHLIVLKNILHHEKISIKNRPVPYTMFLDPQLGRIGLSEKEARKQGLNIKVVTLPMEKTARGCETGETKGLMKAVVDADSKQILGAAMLAAEGGEVMSVLQMAMLGKITYETIREMIFAHPLYTESLNNLFIPLTDT